MCRGSASVANVAPGSLLHRLLRITPGYTPEWFCSRDECLGMDLLIAGEVGVGFGSVLTAQCRGWWWLVPPALAAVVWFGLKVHIPFQDRERWGRARRRRGECVWCGQASV